MKSSNLLSNESLSNLENLHIKAKKVVEGFIVGLHRSPYHGFSVEFSDHRPYGLGDEVRHIDWKLWGKTDRFFVKRYEEETNLKAHLLIDCSQSMSYGSNNSNKLEYAKILGASLSYMLIKNQDAVGFYAFDSNVKKIIQPKSTKGHLSTILSEIEKLEAANKTNIAQAIHECADKTHKKGLVIVISDLLDDEHKILTSLKHLLYKGHEVIVFHILDNQEINLDFNDRVKFVDLENKNTIIADTRQLNKIYKKKISKFIDFYKKNCFKKKIDYVNITTNQSLDIALSEYIMKRKKLY
ncbi:MAG: DUF58 domain-containing protein [Candidatus Marinimicrobia bacterium]|nr:DUF58 domain-containing protein [Candidatus Neomarinimicrobiota bacterium]|tara:strand:- start:4797 stop:5687 length:891 start_codon:yes stop_codon:yes gene_type:complete